MVSSEDLSLSARLVKATVDSPSAEDRREVTTDEFRHRMGKAGQEMHPEIRVPYSKLVETPSDLDILSVAELQSCFEATFKQDKEFESERMRAAFARDMAEMNRILEAETANSQLLMNLADALKRKGVEPRMPQSASFMFAARESAELHCQALKRLQEDNCKMQ